MHPHSLPTLLCKTQTCQKKYIPLDIQRGTITQKVYKLYNNLDIILF